MTTVSEFLRARALRQVREYGIVVWYDPHHQYTGVLDDTIEGIQVLQYNDSFFALRHAADFALVGDTPQPVIVYVPLDQFQTHNALAELERAGIVLAPGQQPPERDTTLTAVARNALEAHFAQEVIESIVEDVAAGRLTLEDLDKMSRPPEVPVVIETIFDSKVPETITLRFMTEPELDTKIRQRKALDQLVEFHRDVYGVEATPRSLEGLRAAMAHHLLLTEMVVKSGQPEDPEWDNLNVAASPVAQAASVRVVEEWRNRRDLAASYVHWADEVAKERGLEAYELLLETLRKISTFRGLERNLQMLIAETLAQQTNNDLLSLARERRQGFWAEQDPNLQVAWALVADASGVLLEAGRIERELRARKTWRPARLVQQYTSEETAWCRLDTSHLHMEQRAFSLELSQTEGLRQLLVAARHRYDDVTNQLAETFSRAWKAAKYEIGDLSVQADTFRDVVRPQLNSGARVAYILVDALRYEMAQELVDRLNEATERQSAAFRGSHIELSSRLATLPTLTKVNMATLLPGAEISVTLATPDKHGKLVPEINGQLIRTRDDRLAVLEHAVDGPVQSLTLEELVYSNKRERQALEQTKMIVVTSQEIDQVPENLGKALAHRVMGGLLSLLQRALSVLVDVGVQHVIIAADHGYLFFGQDIDEGQKIDSPGGETVELHRRVWVGRGGEQSPGYVRLNAADLQLGGDLEFAFPHGLGFFKAPGGSMNYFHGGSSLQERIVPVMHVALAPPTKPTETRTSWTLAPARDTVTTRIFSVTISGKSQELFPVAEKRIRVEARVDNEVIGVPASATYGFDDATSDVVMEPDPSDNSAYQPNTLTIALIRVPEEGEATLYLLDAETGQSLADTVRLPIDIAMR